MRARWLLACVVAACGGDPTGPSLDVATPTRGLLEAPSQVSVEGTATAPGEGVERVEVNGVAAMLDPTSGAFSATLSLDSGTQLIETVATAFDGSVTRDVRAVSVGSFAAPGSLAAGRAMQIGNDSLRIVTEAIAATIDTPSVAAQVMSAPVKNEGSEAGCDLDRVTVTSMNAPVGVLAMFGLAGGLAGESTYIPYTWSFSADYSDSTCAVVTGTFSFETEELHIEYLLTLLEETGGRTVEILNPQTIYHHPFMLDDGTLEAAVANRVTEGVPDDIAVALMNASLPRIKSRTDAWLESQAVDDTVSISGIEFTRQLAPTIVGNARGLTLTFESALRFGEAAPGYVGLGGEPPVLDSRYASVSIAIDEINQMLGVFWRGGGFDITLEGRTFEMLVPPSARIEGSVAKLVFGDWVATDGDDRVAFSGSASLVSGRSEDDLYLATADLVLDGTSIVGGVDGDLTATAAAEMQARLDELLGKVSMPAAPYAWPAVSASPGDGYITIDTAQ